MSRNIYRDNIRFVERNWGKESLTETNQFLSFHAIKFAPLSPSLFVSLSTDWDLQIESISDGKRPGNVSNDRIGAARTG